MNISLMCNVAATYLALGKYRDAEEIQTKALAIAEKARSVLCVCLFVRLQLFVSALECVLSLCVLRL